MGKHSGQSAGWQTEISKLPSFDSDGRGFDPAS